MRLRKGILIRIVIYGSLMAYFGWQQYQRIQAEKEATEQREKRVQELEGAKRSVTLPDGSTQDVFYVNPEQAKRLFGVDPKKAKGGSDQGSEPSGADAAAAPEPAPAPAGPPADAPAKPVPGDPEN